MRLATIRLDERETGAIVTPVGLLTLGDVNQHLKADWPTEVFDLLITERLGPLNHWYRSGGAERLTDLGELAVPADTVRYAPLYRHPRKIWGIGLNYVDHAGDLAEKPPAQTGYPGNFAKFDTTIIGPDDTIEIPVVSENTTAESELGVIFGKTCRAVPAEDWLSVVAGFTTIIDMTAEDILRLNPRYLTHTKNFDTFFSFGPELVTPDEVDDVMALNVATVHNGQVHAQNVVANMTFPPPALVEFQTSVATMLPGDIISTGTPRAVPIRDGDTVECRIDGFTTLRNPVIDLKVAR